MATDEDRRVQQESVEQSRFRAANERLRGTFASHRFEAGDRAPFICECADPGCYETVMLSLTDYDRIRAESTWFVVVAGHEDDETRHELILEDDLGYVIVEKVGLAGAEAARLR